MLATVAGRVFDIAEAGGHWSWRRDRLYRDVRSARAFLRGWTSEVHEHVMIRVSADEAVARWRRCASFSTAPSASFSIMRWLVIWCIAWG
eukprot:4377651-Pyramimonas_sp.AAC.1